MTRIIEKFDPELVSRAVNRIADPVIQTITPLGNNVLFEKDMFSNLTNDGVTIARLIDSENETEDTIIQMIKYGALSTNEQAGDGTSTTILLTKKFVDIGLDMIKAGEKPIKVKRAIDSAVERILANSEHYRSTVADGDLFKVATISANNDESLAKNVVDVIDTAGLDGMIFLEESKTSKTIITKDTGFGIEGGMLTPVLGNLSKGRADYNMPHVFITDKKLYHVAESKEILETAYKNGIRDIVIIAKDFLGESANFLVANHLDEKVPLNILLVPFKTTGDDVTPFYDLATYLGTEVVTEKSGSFVGNLNDTHYKQIQRAYSAGPRTILVSNEKVNPELTQLVARVREEKESDPNNKQLTERLASLTTGTVTLEVGGNNGPEVRELIYRYEDAINATRAAMRSGYVVGGGLTLYNSSRNTGEVGEQIGLASIQQIANNCGIDFGIEKYQGTVGYNGKKEDYSDLEKDGIIEPYDVFKLSLSNAGSIAGAILTSGYIISVKRKED